MESVHADPTEIEPSDPVGRDRGVSSHVEDQVEGDREVSYLGPGSTAASRSPGACATASSPPTLRSNTVAHQAVGIDISAAQIERARENVPDAEFVHSDLTEIEFEQAFAAIASFYVIEHVPRDEHAEIFERFHRWLAPGGHLLFTIEPDDEPGIVGDWLGTPMFFSQHDAETTLALVRAAGFEVLRAEGETQVEGDREVSYLWVLARRGSGTT